MILSTDLGRTILRWHVGDIVSDVDAREQYLADGARGDVAAHPLFDPRFVERHYPLSRSAGESSLAFVCRFQHFRWCYPTASDIAADADAESIRNGGLFDEGAFRRQVGIEDHSVDAAAYFCSEGFRLLIEPSDGFSLAAYMLQYPDIARQQINGLLHYELNGRAEGRVAFSAVDLADSPGLFVLDDVLDCAGADQSPISINANQSGLMNRIMPMMSMLEHCRISGRRAAIWWQPSRHCAAAFETCLTLSCRVFARRRHRC